MQVKKFLVTGGAGFIGSHVVRALLAHYDAPVRVLHLPKENLLNLTGLNVELFPGDMTNPADVSAAVEGCDVVFHLAAVYALWLPDMSLMQRVNVDAANNLFRTCHQQGVKRVVYTSSFACFAGQGLDTACTEKSPFNLPESYYSRTKYESHKLAEAWARKGLDVVIVCPTCPLGPGDVGPTPTGRVLVEAFNMPVLLGVNTDSNYIDVRDCAQGHLLALEKGRTGESYILGGENYTHPDIVRRLQRIAGIHRRVVMIEPEWLRPMAKLGVWLAEHVTGKAPFTTEAELVIARRGLVADASKARHELGLQVRPIEETIHDALLWFIEHGYITDSEVINRFHGLQAQAA